MAEIYQEFVTMYHINLRLDGTEGVSQCDDVIAFYL